MEAGLGWHFVIGGLMCRVTVIYKSLLLKKMNTKCHPTALMVFQQLAKDLLHGEKG